jgi:transcriptional regulator GlxA family with amidase domain
VTLAAPAGGDADRPRYAGVIRITSNRHGGIRPAFVLAAKRRTGDDSRMPARRIVIVAYPGVQPLDVIGPAEVFNTAARLERDAYSVEVVAAERGPLESTTVGLVADRALRNCRGPVDTLIVAGGPGVREACRDPEILSWVRAAAARSRRVCSVCTGAFLLAEAGLLDGRRATTHWAGCDRLAEGYEAITVEREPIFVRDGDVYTSAGVTAGMDLGLALVEQDIGRRTALEVARWLVLFVKRPGGQSQFSAQLAAQTAEREPLRELQDWIAGNLDADLSVPALALRAHMSERNFARAFRRELGMTPAAYVETARVEAARMALESTEAAAEVIARRVGFGTVETMRRAFHRRLGVGPAEYRARFGSPKAA